MAEMKIFNVQISGVEQSMIASGFPMMKGEAPEYTDSSLIYDVSGSQILKMNENGTFESIKNIKPIVGSLAKAVSGSGHDCFLKGITVTFDITYPVYWSPQLQRYHFLDAISSSSSMHSIIKFDLDKSFNDKVNQYVIAIAKDMVDVYNCAIDTKHKYIKEMTFYDRRPVFIVTNNKENLSNSFESFSIRSIKVWTLKEFFQRIIATCPQGLMKTMRITTNALQLKTIISQRSNHKLDEWRYFTKWAKSLYFWRYLDMYSEELTTDDNITMGAFNFTLSHYLDGTESINLGHQFEKIGKGKPYDILLALKDHVKNTDSIAEHYINGVMNNAKPIIYRMNYLYARKKVVNQKDTIKKLENYILQHSSDIKSVEELRKLLNY